MIINPKMNEETVTFSLFSGGPRASFGKLCLLIPYSALPLKGTQAAQMYRVGFVPALLDNKHISPLQMENYMWMPFKQDPEGYYWVWQLKRQLFDKMPFYSHPTDILAEVEAVFPGINAMMSKAKINWKAQVASALCGPIHTGFHHCYRIVLCNASWSILSNTAFATGKVDDEVHPNQINWTNPLIANAQIDGNLPMFHQWSWFSDDVDVIAAAELLAKELSKLHPDLCVAFGRNVPDAVPGIPKSKLYVRYFVGGKAYKECPDIKEI